MGILTLKFRVSKHLPMASVKVDYSTATGYWMFEIKVAENLVASGNLWCAEDQNCANGDGNWKIIAGADGFPCLKYQQAGMLVGSFWLSIDFTKLQDVGAWSLEVELSGISYLVNHHDGKCQVINFDLKWNRKDLLPDNWKLTVAINGLTYVMYHADDVSSVIVSGLQWDYFIGFPKVSSKFQNGVFRTTFSGLPWDYAHTDTWTLEFLTHRNSFLLSHENGVWHVFISGIEWIPSCTLLSSKWQSDNYLEWSIQISATTKYPALHPYV